MDNIRKILNFLTKLHSLLISVLTDVVRGTSLRIIYKWSNSFEFKENSQIQGIVAGKGLNRGGLVIMLFD